ncbi:MAG: UvrD-helicase domain-containing protein, partial [Treponemataceae bacterium]|nr:UvrD-helicase domain-containing protein [Treponemataceae bacterium]
MEEGARYAYLDLLPKKLDASQKAACCRTENAVVAAGAGSGKTQVLATRFAWLVMSKDVKASAILTLTYTNKAAGEMYGRIYRTLRRFADDPAVPQRERENAARAVADFSNVHIQTLDSYCGGIVRQAANRYGIRPDFTTGGSSADMVRRLALPFALSRRDNPAVRRFAEAGRLQQFAEDVFAEAVSECTSLADPPGVFQSKLAAQIRVAADAWNALVCGKPGGADALPPSVRPLPEIAADIQRLMDYGDPALRDGEFSAAAALFSDVLFDCPPVFPCSGTADESAAASFLPNVRAVEEWFSRAERCRIESRNRSEYVKSFKALFNEEMLGT